MIVKAIIRNIYIVRKTLRINDSKGDNKKHVYVVRKTKGWVRMNKNNGKVIAIVEQGKLKEKERVGKNNEKGITIVEQRKIKG